MNPLLAQAEFTSPVGIAAFLACAVFCMAMINQGFKLVRNFKGEVPQTIAPQPFEVKPSAEYVHKREFDSHMAKNTERHGQLFAEIGAVKEQARRELKADVDSLRGQLTEVSVQVGRIEASTELQNQQLARIEANLISAQTRRDRA